MYRYLYGYSNRTGTSPG